MPVEDWPDAHSLAHKGPRAPALLPPAEAAARRRLRARMIHELYLHVVTLDQLDTLRSGGGARRSTARVVGTDARVSGVVASASPPTTRPHPHVRVPGAITSRGAAVPGGGRSGRNKPWP